MFLKTDLKGYDLKTLGVKFDVILIEPPLEVRKYEKTQEDILIKK